MRIYHVAVESDWHAARRLGSYTISIRGRTLEQEGFIHAARREQVPLVLERFHAEVAEPLLVLEIDTDRLDVPWREEPVGDATFPHILGPLDTEAVIGWRPASDYRPESRSLAPRPPLVTAFRGLGIVLVVAAVVLLGFTVAAHVRVNHGTLPPTAEFLLWTYVVTATACAITCGAVANHLLLRGDTASPANPADRTRDRGEQPVTVAA